MSAMNLDITCTHRRVLSAADQEIYDRWHARLLDGSLVAYLHKHSTVFALPPRKLTRPRCACGKRAISSRAKYCTECKRIAERENVRRWAAGQAKPRGQYCKRSKV